MPSMASTPVNDASDFYLFRSGEFVSFGESSFMNLKKSQGFECVALRILAMDDIVGHLSWP